MKVTIILCICLLCSLIEPARSQGPSEQFAKRNTIYAAFAGISGSVCSINYDRILFEKENAFVDLTIGFGYYPFFKNVDPIIGVPVAINYTRGSGSHHYELGVGLTYNSGINRQTHLYVLDGIDWSDSYIETENEHAIWSSFRVGYKYQKPDGGIFVRIGLTPLLKIKTLSAYKDDNKLFPAIGIGLGYTL